METLLQLAVAPGLFLMFYFYKRDKHEPEPPRKVLKVMFWGALCAIPAIIMELVGEAAMTEAGLNPNTLFSIALKMFVVVALSEELCKLWVVRATIYHDPELDEPFDGIVYCVAASLGFAILENILYVVDGGVGVGVVRALLSVPAHALFAVFMGYYVGLSKFAPDASTRRRYVLTGLFLATLSHGLYDFVLSVQVPLVQLTVLPLMGVFWALGLWKVRKHLLVSPHDAANQPPPMPATPPPLPGDSSY